MVVLYTKSVLCFEIDPPFVYSSSTHQCFLPVKIFESLKIVLKPCVQEWLYGTLSHYYKTK